MSEEVAAILIMLGGRKDSGPPRSRSRGRTCARYTNTIKAGAQLCAVAVIPIFLYIQNYDHGIKMTPLA